MKVVLFDLDGTLVSTGGAGVRALDRAFEELYGLERAMETVQPAGKTDPRIIREVFEVKFSRPAQDWEVARVAETYVRLLPKEIWFSGDYRTMPGIEACLKVLRDAERVRVGLGTGNLEKGARIKLEPSGLNEYFVFGGFGSDSEVRAELLKIGAARAGAGRELSPRDVLVVGDTVLDIKAAREAGMSVAAVSCGHAGAEALASAGPDLLLEDFRDPEPLLRFLRNGASDA